MLGKRYIPVRCPICSSPGPFFDIADLHSYLFEGNRVVKELSGHRLACQSCPGIFSVGPQGTFKHSVESFPPSPVALRRPDPAANPSIDRFEPDRALPPIPLPRPPFQP